MADEALQGVEAGNALSDASRKALAFNALAKVYGPIAGDPTAALQMQTYGYNQQANPLDLEGKQLSNTGQAQTNAFNGALDPLKLAQQQEINNQAQLMDPLDVQGKKLGIQQDQSTVALGNLTVGQEPQKFAADQAEVAARTQQARAGATESYSRAANTNQSTAMTGASQDRMAGQQILNDVNSVYANGGTSADALAAYDAHAPTIAKMNGITPDHVAQLRQIIAQGPAATKQLSDALSGASGGGQSVTVAGAKGQPGVVVPANAIDYAATQFRANGQMPPLGQGSSAVRAAILARAAQQAQQEGATGETDRLNQQAFKARQTYVDDLAKSTPTSAGGLVRSAGAVLSHIDTLGDYVTALQNGDLKAANALGQEWKAQTGKPAPTNFDAQKTIVGDELTRYLIARGGGQGDRQALQETLARANSPQALKGVIDTYTKDIAGQLGAQRQQASAVNATQQFDAQLTPRARALLNPQAAPPQGAAPAGAQPSQGWSNMRVAP